MIQRRSLRKLSDRECLNSLFIQLYENDSQIDNLVYEQVINKNANRKDLRSAIQTLTTNPTKVDPTHPDNPGNAFMTSMLGLGGYDPLRKNNIPYVAFNEEELPNHRTCLHIGSQTRNRKDVHPTFQRYLLAKGQNQEKNKIAYLYINLMKRDQSVQVTQKGLTDNFVRSSEGARSHALEALNKNKDLKVAVVTLPADGPFFLGNFNMAKGKAKKSKKEGLVSILKAVKTSIQDDLNDFYFSDNIKERLFGDFTNNVIDSLFYDAVRDIMGPVVPTTVNAEERQAILFHFVKYTLTNYIIENLDPLAYNTSCKDAIDRGAIHSLWYHLNMLYKHGTPMSEEAFYKHLYAPALLVKYRPINDNQNLIWNAMRFRLANDPDFKQAHPWAQDWINKNSPKSMRKDFLSDSENDISSSSMVSDIELSSPVRYNAESDIGSDVEIEVLPIDDLIYLDDQNIQFDQLRDMLVKFNQSYQKLTEEKENDPSNYPVKTFVRMFEHQHVTSIMNIVDFMISSIDDESKPDSALLSTLNRSLQSIKMLCQNSHDLIKFHDRVKIELNRIALQNKENFQNEKKPRAFSPLALMKRKRGNSMTNSKSKKMRA